MMAVTFSAWRDDDYIELLEILLVLGSDILDLVWEAHIEEMAPQSGTELFEQSVTGRRLDTLDLVRAAAAGNQVIDGVFKAYGPRAESVVVTVRAVDSTSWDVESRLDKLRERLLSRFSDPTDIRDD